MQVDFIFSKSLILNTLGFEELNIISSRYITVFVLF